MPDEPGFYDQAAFFAAEKIDPSILEKYAEFVSLRPFAEGSEALIREEIVAASQFVHDKIRASQRLGRCVDGSMLLSRVLESRGIWNYVLKGATTIAYPLAPKLPNTHYWPFILKTNAAQYGHCWVVAPPFRVVDVTLKLQPYRFGEGKNLPDIVYSESVETAPVEPKDLINPAEARQLIGRLPRMADLEEMSPGLQLRIRKLGVAQVETESATIKYVPVGASAPDLALDKMCDGVGCGQTPAQIVAEYASARPKS